MGSKNMEVAVINNERKMEVDRLINFNLMRFECRY